MAAPRAAATGPVASAEATPLAAYGATTSPRRASSASATAVTPTAEKVRVAAPTTAVGVTAVAEAEEARVGLAVARDAATGAASDEVTEAVASALGEATVDGRTAREAVQPGMARRPPSARLRPRARTTAR